VMFNNILNTGRAKQPTHRQSDKKHDDASGKWRV